MSISSPPDLINPYYLFGYVKPWLPPAWTTTDDRVRGGDSRSYLSALPDNCARFYGHLDIEKLGGAGFASQFSPVTNTANTGENIIADINAVIQNTLTIQEETKIQKWDLSDYDGVVLEYGSVNDSKALDEEERSKIYTLILKDRGSEEGLRDDGRAKAGVNWEYDFQVGKGDTIDSTKKSGGRSLWIPWDHFRATYRGRDVNNPGKLKKDQIWRVGIMMRSLFGKQKGDFSLELRSLYAKKVVDSVEESKSKLS